jgi:hypothetical protein
MLSDPLDFLDLICLTCMSPTGVFLKRSHSDCNESSERKRSKFFSTSRETLLELLDLSGLENIEQVKDRFNKITKLLLFQFRICLLHKGETTAYELLEVEFYWNNHTWHPDPFCHPGPRNFCEW